MRCPLVPMVDGGHRRTGDDRSGWHGL